MKKEITFQIFGEVSSKANRRIPTKGKNGKPIFIKNKKAREFQQHMEDQCPHMDEPFMDDVCVEMIVYYSSRRPDLDESIVLDGMQGKIYKNDRQVKEKHIYWGLDRECPRAVIRVTPLEGGSIPSYLRCLPRQDGDIEG